ncbi:MAG: glycosyltransferase [Alphaproteobacteria bacterium]|nr:glycosyltransferase [Alphaproteobacteria bacterium]
MNILIVTDAWHPQINGVVRTYDYLSGVLKQQGHTVRVLSHMDFETHLPLPGYSEIKLVILPYRHLRQIAEAFAPDHIHIATEGPLGWAARRYCLRHGLPFTSAYHTHFPEYTQRRLSKLSRIFPALHNIAGKTARRTLQAFHAPAAAVLVATQSLEERLKGHGFENVFHLMSRGIDTALFSPGDKTLFQDLPKPVALYVGRLAVEKSVEDFLEMDWPGSKIVVGSGPAFKTLSAQYPNALFLGQKTGEELAACYRSADLFVFPSRTDTFGLVMLEALACGLPVAAYDVAGPRDIISQPFLGALDPDNLSRAAQVALHCGNPQERAAFIRAHYSWPDSANQFMQAVAYARKTAPAYSLAAPGHQNAAMLRWGSAAFIALSALLKTITFFPLLPYLAILTTGLYIGVIGRFFSFPVTRPFTDESEQDADRPPGSVSIVIPAHNEETVIRETVLDMANITYPDCEILIMDDRSTDATARILEETIEELHAQGKTHIRFHTRPADSIPGKSAVLNDALSMTSGDFIAVFDADARVTPDIFSYLSTHLLDPEISALQLRKSISNLDGALLTRVQALEYGFDALLQEGRSLFKTAAELRGNGQIVRREAVLAVNGWSEHTITDDLDLSTRLHAQGRHIAFIPEHEVLEQAVTDAGDLYKQRLRWAEGSLRRYLDFGLSLLCSRHAPLRVKLDAALYAVNTFIPVLIALEALLLILLWPFMPLAGAGLLWLLIALGLLWAAPIPGLLKTVESDFALSRPKAFIMAIQASSYMLILWFPVILHSYLRIVFKPGGKMHWHKTARVAPPPKT